MTLSSQAPRLALYQPDIPQNAGSLLRLSACLDFPVEVIEPCGFLWDEKRMRRAGMDYLDLARCTRHSSWEAFCQSPARAAGRLVLMTTKASTRMDQFHFLPGDIILMGRESSGVPDEVAAFCDQRLRIPLRGGTRSINVAMAAAMAMSEAIRQLGCFPADESGVGETGLAEENGDG